MIGAARNTAMNFVDRLVRDHSGLVVALIAVFLAVFIAGMATAPNFLTIFNFKTIIRDAALVGIMAIGLTFVTLSGNFFLLSMKETAALSIICFATSMAAGYGFEISFLLTMAIAVTVGAAQGALIGLGGNPIIVTLGAAGLLFGLGSWWSDNLVVSFRRPHGAEWLGTGSFLGLPNITIAFILIAIVAELALRHTAFGRQVYLIGANRAAGACHGPREFRHGDQGLHHRLGLFRLRCDRLFGAGFERTRQLLLIGVRLVGRHDNHGHCNGDGRRKLHHGRIRFDTAFEPWGSIHINRRQHDGAARVQQRTASACGRTHDRLLDHRVRPCATRCKGTGIGKGPMP